MKRLSCFLVVFFLALSLHAQSDSSSSNQLLITLDESLLQVETMLNETIINMMQLKENLQRVSQLLVEAKQLSTEQLQLYETLLKRYENVVESFLLLNQFYKGRKTIMLIEGGVIAVLATGLIIAIAVK